MTGFTIPRNESGYVDVTAMEAMYQEMLAEDKARAERNADLPKYQIFSHVNPNALSEKITNLMHQGWKPVGGLTVYYTDVGEEEFERWFAQAMILLFRGD